MKRIFFYHFCLLLSMLLLYTGLLHAGNWKDDFEKICGNPGTATTFPAEQIKELIQESDRLLEKIEKLGDPANKVYLFRLKKCRNFFEYILEMREAESEKKHQGGAHE